MPNRELYLVHFDRKKDSTSLRTFNGNDKNIGLVYTQLFLPNIPLWSPWKNPKNQRFSDVFRHFVVV